MFGSKKRKQQHEEELLKQYEAGKVLQVNNGTDNKEHFKTLPDIEVEEEVEETNLDDLPEIEKKKNIPDLLVLGDLYLKRNDKENAKQIYEEIQSIFNPQEDKELYQQILNYYQQIT